jgi:putative membrane protein
MELDTRRAAMVKHLVDAPEDAFDNTYVDQQVLAHEETVTLMRTYAESGDNPQLRSVALGTLPVVERHLNHAKMMKSQLAA